MIIELCEANEMASLLDILEQERFDVVTYPCLDRCEACFMGPYAYVDAKLYEADDPTTLLEMIRQVKM